MDDLTEPVKLIFRVSLEARSKTLYEIRHEGSLVHHTPREVEDRLALFVARTIKEIDDSGFTKIELGRIRRTRDASLVHLKKEDSKDAK